MRKVGIIMAVMLFLMSNVDAQELKDIKLNAPDKERGASVMQALAMRKSDRTFAEKPLSLQDLSDLLWAANGINRPESGKRTAPSAMNRQDIDIYVCLPQGAFLYDATAQVLKAVCKEDLRAAVGGKQDFVKEAPVSLVLVSDISKFNGDEQHRLITGAMDAGIVSQNIALFCAATGLVTVPRMSMDQKKLQEALQLKAGQRLMMNHPVGYPKK